MILLIGTLVASIALALAATRFRVTAFFATLAFELAFVVGVLRLEDQGRASSTTRDLFVLAVVAMVLGYAVTVRLCRPRTDAAEPTDRTAPIDASSLLVPVAAVFVLTGYHFAKVGIPILSGNVELSRWRFTDSGLFGLPSRAYLFGLPLVTMLAYLVRRQSPDDRLAHRIFAATAIATLATRVLGGFKGEVLDLVVLVFMVEAATSTGHDVRRLAKRYLPAVTFALLFAVAVSSLYGSTQQRVSSGQTSLVGALVDRSTTVAARPTVAVIEARLEGIELHRGNTIVNDYRYYGSRYVGAGDPDRFDFKTKVSAYLNTRNLDTARQRDVRTFVVPVTIGLLGVLIYNAGWLGLGLAFLLGAGYAATERIVHRRGPVASLAALTTVIALHQSIHKGDIAFQSLNWAIMAAFVTLLLSVAARQRARRDDERDAVDDVVDGRDRTDWSAAI